MNTDAIGERASGINPDVPLAVAHGDRIISGLLRALMAATLATMVRAIIFDVDGVLIDSYRAHFESWRQLADEAGQPFDEQTFARTFGRTSRDIIAEIWSPVPSARVIGLLDERKEAMFREIVNDNFPAMPGAADLIARLRAADLRIGLGSSGPPENVNLVIDRLGVGGMVDATITGADVTRGKPDPQVFRLAAERLSCPPDQCVVVEDAAAGVEAAHRAGMACVGLVSTGRTPEELAAAEHLAFNLDEITLELLRAVVQHRSTRADG